jgi:signal transduction histidine kinase
MFRNSLTFRLVATAALWLVGWLAAAGVLLVFLFRDHIERRYDRQLIDHMEELVAASEITTSGALMLAWTPSDPRFNRPHSGWYWQISSSDKILVRSESLWHDHLAVEAPGAGAGAQVQMLTGPGQEVLRGLVANITLPRAHGHLLLTVAGPLSDIDRNVDAFVVQLALTLGTLGVGLLGAVLLQVRFGLQPLRALRQALARIRKGRGERLPEGFPEEVQPVVQELNALLDRDAAMIDRARTQAGNLAHALKNPLTVIRNEAREVEGERGALLGNQIAAISEHVDRYLVRARAAGSGDVLGARAAVADVVEDLRFSMDLLHRERGLDIVVSSLDGLVFRGDARDLEEMVGNLMDNACKWAKTQISLDASRVDGRLVISVEDDGPGIPGDRRAEVLHRGRRLDESVAGSGLGLDIVQEIALLYRGSLTLDGSELGGLRARLDLPAAD